MHLVRNICVLEANVSPARSVPINTLILQESAEDDCMGSNSLSEGTASDSQSTPGKKVRETIHQNKRLYPATSVALERLTFFFRS